MENLNSYKKFAPNVFVAKCHEQNEKGETVIITTKYGQEHENEIHNYLGKTADDFYLYSITRCDGFNSQERAKKKAEKLTGYASNAEKRSNEAYETRSTKQERDFLSLGEPIKVGHHSEKRHRKLFEKYDNKMRKSIEERDKAENYKTRAEYWEAKASKINLSMPESLEFYEFKLEEAIKNHKFLKDNPSERRHGYSLTYANKTVKETRNNLGLAVRLWGSDEVIKQIADEKKEKAEAEAGKSKKKTDIVLKYGGFFAFNTDQLKSGHAKILEAGHIEKGEKVRHIKHGLYIPSKNVDAFLKEL
jgi:hypothetical protein